MTAGKYNLIIEQGATYLQDFIYKDSTGSYIDLSGYSARMQIRPTVESSTIYISLSSSLSNDGSGISLSGSQGLYSPISGTVGIIISAISSSNLDFDYGYYDLELVSGSYVNRLLEGKVKLSKNVTR